MKNHYNLGHDRNEAQGHNRNPYNIRSDVPVLIESRHNATSVVDATHVGFTVQATPVNVTHAVCFTDHVASVHWVAVADTQKLGHHAGIVMSWIQTVSVMCHVDTQRVHKGVITFDSKAVVVNATADMRRALNHRGGDAHPFNCYGRTVDIRAVIREIGVGKGTHTIKDTKLADKRFSSILHAHGHRSGFGDRVPDIPSAIANVVVAKRAVEAICARTSQRVSTVCNECPIVGAHSVCNTTETRVVGGNLPAVAVEVPVGVVARHVGLAAT
jgi:hypothetical protein